MSEELLNNATRGVAIQHESIVLTPNAIKQTRVFYATVEAYRGLSLRLYLDGKGCDGFFYGVTFDKASPEDIHFEQDDGIDVIVDPKTLLFVGGATIDWISDERGQGYLVANPSHKKYRGKFYKRPSWQKHLT